MACLPCRINITYLLFRIMVTENSVPRSTKTNLAERTSILSLFIYLSNWQPQNSFIIFTNHFYLTLVVHNHKLSFPIISFCALFFCTGRPFWLDFSSIWEKARWIFIVLFLYKKINVWERGQVGICKYFLIKFWCGIN